MRMTMAAGDASSTEGEVAMAVTADEQRTLELLQWNMMKLNEDIRDADYGTGTCGEGTRQCYEFFGNAWEVQETKDQAVNKLLYDASLVMQQTWHAMSQEVLALAAERFEDMAFPAIEFMNGRAGPRLVLVDRGTPNAPPALIS